MCGVQHQCPKFFFVFRSRYVDTFTANTQICERPSAHLNSTKRFNKVTLQCNTLFDGSNRPQLDNDPIYANQF